MFCCLKLTPSLLCEQHTVFCAEPVVTLKLNPEASQKQHVFSWRNPLLSEQLLCIITIPSILWLRGSSAFPSAGLKVGESFHEASSCTLLWLEFHEWDPAANTGSKYHLRCPSLSYLVSTSSSPAGLVPCPPPSGHLRWHLVIHLEKCFTTPLAPQAR